MKRALGLLFLAAASCSFPEYALVQQQSQTNVPPTDSPPSPPQTTPAATCSDGKLSPNEVDVDCGPACGAGCGTGKACTASSECQSGLCNLGICAIPSCTDGAKNRTETDVDCGGSDGCKACSVGLRCSSSYDCDGGACTNGRCLEPSCGDGLKNQTETDVDCGGSVCDGCSTKMHCGGDSDCSHAKCALGRCQASGCDDGVLNGDETDTDCGGSCPICDDFKFCKTGADCKSMSCASPANFCLAISCTDNIKNGTEPTTDCGKDCQKKCGMTDACSVDADCQSGKCGDEQRCVPKSATNTPLATNGWVVTASATFSASTSPSNGVDGNSSTRWESGTGQMPGMWFLVDMRKSVPIFSVEVTCLTSDTDYPRSIRVLLSEDGQNFNAATGTIAGKPSLHLDLGGAKVARFVKLEAEQDTGGVWWRIDDMRVLQ